MKQMTVKAKKEIENVKKQVHAVTFMSRTVLAYTVGIATYNKVLGDFLLVTVVLLS